MTDQPARFRHRTAEVEAMQWTGSNAEQMRAFCGPDFDEIDPEDQGENPDATAAVRESTHGTWQELEPGYWVVKIGDVLYGESDADFKASFEPATTSPQPDRVTAIYDAIDAFQRQFRTVGGLQHAQIRSVLAEHLDRALPAALPVPPAPDQAAVRASIAAALRVHYHCDGGLDPDGPIPCRCGWMDPGPDATHETDFDAHMADVVLAVLPPSADRAAVLRAAADALAAHPGPIPWLPGLPKGEGEGFWWDTRDRDAAAGLLRQWAGGTVDSDAEAHRPRRGDQFEAWLKAVRGEFEYGDSVWPVLDWMLDRYRLHADTGTPLDQHACEGQHCDCPAAARPAAGAGQDGAQQ